MRCWALLVLAPRWRGTRALVLSSALSLLLAAAYAGLTAAHYLGPHGGEGSFGSLDAVAALFRDRWALLAGWVHHLCFDLWTGTWEVRDAQRGYRTGCWCRACCSRLGSGRWGCCILVCASATCCPN